MVTRSVSECAPLTHLLIQLQQFFLCRGIYLQYPNGDLECPVANERHWQRRDLNFDHFGLAMLTLFTMLTKEGWQM